MAKDPLSFRGRYPTALRFGTSGLRGLITDITDLEAYINARGFLRFAREIGDAAVGTTVCIGGDLRPSTERILAAVAQAIRDEEMTVKYLGRLPTPALTYYGIQNDVPSIMVTGSHIPYDRNGIKFNKSTGEVLKSDEVGILAAVAAVRETQYACDSEASLFDDNGMFRQSPSVPEVDTSGSEAYMLRYMNFLPDNCLAGLRVIVYQHSAVGRDLLVDLLKALGAEAIAMGRSDEFVAIDTEDITADRLAVLQQLADEAAATHGPIDAVISTDGDSDRPLMAGIDEDGAVRFIGGDILGVIVADYLHADSICLPISANDVVDLYFADKGIHPCKTKIGSPYVIAAMADASGQTRVGWEANGGFLTGSSIARNGQTLAPLPTRDAVLPLVATLHAAAEAGCSICELFAQLPPRFSKAGLLDDFDPDVSQKLIGKLSPALPEVHDLTGVDVEEFADHLQKFFNPDRGFPNIVRLNYIDGVRIFFANGDIAHIRPSGNAPQLRLYACADTQERANEIIEIAIAEPNGLLREMEEWINNQ